MFFKLFAAALGATTALALPTTREPAIREPAINSTLAERSLILGGFKGGASYYDLGIPLPICVQTTGSNLCTTTIVGRPELNEAWVWLFDHNCEMLAFDPQVDWNALSLSVYEMQSIEIPPHTVHAGRQQIFKNLIDDDFSITKSGWTQTYDGDQRLWDNGWNAGESVDGFEIKRMNWICR